MPEDGVIQLRRNQSKQALSGPHLARHGKGNKGSTTRLSKYSGSNARKSVELPRTHSASSLNLNSTNGDSDASDAGHHAYSRANGPHHRGVRGPKANISVGAAGAAAFGSHRYRGLSGIGNLAQSHRKPVIQLEREEDDEADVNDNGDGSGSEDFEDYEDDESEDTKKKVPSVSDAHLSIGIQPVEPTPPKLSEETVISVSSLADMASALEGARNKSAFVGEDDLISTAVNRSKNLGNMGRMVRGWNASSQGAPGNMGSRKASSANLTSKAHRSSIPGEEDPREFEKVFREYTNARAITNPVINSLYRISATQDTAGASLRGAASASSTPSINGDGMPNNGGISGLQLPSIKKVNSLVATTANQMSDYSDGNGAMLPQEYSGVQSHGAIESVSTYTLNKIWQMGWVDPEYPKPSASSKPRSANGIQGQAIKVQQQLANARSRNSETSSPAAGA